MFFVPVFRDSQTRKIQENITYVEKHFGQMCQMFAAYNRKTAKLRDKADVLVREIGVYADTETPNLKRGMKQFADHLAKIQDYRQAEVKLVYFPLLWCGPLTLEPVLDMNLTEGVSPTGGEARIQSSRAIKNLRRCCET